MSKSALSRALVALFVVLSFALASTQMIAENKSTSGDLPTVNLTVAVDSVSNSSSRNATSSSQELLGQPSDLLSFLTHANADQFLNGAQSIPEISVEEGAHLFDGMALPEPARHFEASHKPAASQSRNSPINSTPVNPLLANQKLQASAAALRQVNYYPNSALEDSFFQDSSPENDNQQQSPRSAKVLTKRNGFPIQERSSGAELDAYLKQQEPQLLFAANGNSAASSRKQEQADDFSDLQSASNSDEMDSMKTDDIFKDDEQNVAEPAAKRQMSALSSNGSPRGARSEADADDEEAEASGQDEDSSADESDESSVGQAFQSVRPLKGIEDSVAGSEEQVGGSPSNLRMKKSKPEVEVHVHASVSKAKLAKADDLQTAAGHHHHGHHGAHYYQYVEVPKKKAWKMGFKRGNHKHMISRHEKGYKNKFHSSFKWNAKEKCKKGKKCHSVGKMTWHYEHHDKKKKHHY